MVGSSPGTSTAHTTLFFFFPGLLFCRIGSPMQCMVLCHQLACMTEWERWVGTVSRAGSDAKKLFWGRVMGTTSWKARELQLNHEPPSGFLPLRSGLLVRVKGKSLHPSTCLCSLFLGRIFDDGFTSSCFALSASHMVPFISTSPRQDQTTEV